MQQLPKQLVATQYLTTSALPYYTALTGAVADITAATATNVSTAAATVTVHMLAAASTAGLSNMIVQARNVPANSSIQLWEIIRQKVPTGSAIAALASLSSSVNLSIGGVEVS